MEQATTSQYKFSYPSVAESENTMFDDLSESLEECQIEGRLGWAVSLCVSEAFCNALVHGNKMNPEKTIFLELDVNQHVVRADITDQGEGDIERIRRRPLPEGLSENGRGIDLIERTANRMEMLNSVNESGLTLKIEFDRSAWNEKGGAEN